MRRWAHELALTFILGVAASCLAVTGLLIIAYLIGMK
jgi:hypothetical protein